MNRNLEPIAKRVNQFFAKAAYRREDWHELSLRIWEDVSRPEFAAKVPDIEYNAFMDVIALIDQYHKPFPGCENFRYASMFPIKKLFHRMLVERGWNPPA